MYFIIMLLWVIFNGKITLEVILVGLALTAAAGILMRIFYGYTVRRDFLFLKKIPLILVYFGILVAQILKSSLIMLRILLHRTENLQKNPSKIHRRNPSAKISGSSRRRTNV